jgi:predicted transcriptional regulator
MGLNPTDAQKNLLRMNVFLDGLLRLTATIVSAHVSNNSLPAEGLPLLIRSVFGALGSVGKEAEVAAAPTPAVPIKRSVFPDYLVCLEDGKKLKMLKRHLQTAYQMTPQQYRERWGLPADYPMVAPEYAARRSDLAKSIGLGRKSTVIPAVPVPLAKKAGRPKKTA